jgi:Fe-S-cluster containining protein
MAVEVSSFEADMIGRYLGRDKQAVGKPLREMTPSQIEKEQQASWQRWTGKPCSLLGEDGKCTVYPVRPVACRTHHNLAYDETNCVVLMKPGMKLEDLPTTPHLNLNEFQMWKTTVMFNGGASYADIREWFPKKEEK